MSKYKVPTSKRDYPRSGVEKLAFSRMEAAVSLGYSRGFIDKEIRAGNLVALKRGRKVLILRDELLRYLHASEQKQVG